MIQHLGAQLSNMAQQHGKYCPEVTKLRRSGKTTRSALGSTNGCAGTNGSSLCRNVTWEHSRVLGPLVFSLLGAGGGGSSTDHEPDAGAAVSQTWGHAQIIALIIRERIFSKSVIQAYGRKAVQSNCGSPFGGGSQHCLTSPFAAFCQSLHIACTHLEILECLLGLAQLSEVSAV